MMYQQQQQPAAAFNPEAMVTNMATKVVANQVTQQIKKSGGFKLSNWINFLEDDEFKKARSNKPTPPPAPRDQ